MTKSLLLNLQEKRRHPEKLEWLVKNTEIGNQSEVLRKALERLYASEYRKFETRRAEFVTKIKTTKAQAAK